MSEYQDFINAKSQIDNECGFAPDRMPSELFPFQEHLVEWSLRKGRSAIYADCGLGKTPIQLAWADNVARKTNRPVLILAPLAVAPQTVREGVKFGIEVTRSSDGKIPKSGIVITNYERIHYFDRHDFAGVVCDESSAIKHFTGARQKQVTEFMREIPYRLLCTATAAPNDYVELGTSSEALGQMGNMDMLGTFFWNMQYSNHPDRYHSGGRESPWKFRVHAELPFWRWVCSWARALRRPSDLGDYTDKGFELPPLVVREQIVEADVLRDGMLFAMPAIGLNEQREERRNTINERCDAVAEAINGHKSAVAWCHLNAEGDRLAQVIPDAVQVAGNDRDEDKEERFEAFARGEIRALVTKPRIGGFGLNWQHCARMTFFPSHSFEQWYQSIRRCWRFGQKRTVEVDVITTKGEARVTENLQRKQEAADVMFDNLVAEMQSEIKRDRGETFTKRSEVPGWLKQRK